MGSGYNETGAKEIKKLRKEIQIIFQDPYSSLNENSDR
jgi:ABC-type microcin C transport system duplicated ATPase subunit YejF